MPTAEQFVKAFTKATSLSSDYPFFENMKNALGGSFISGNGLLQIVLDTKLKGTYSRIIEDAVRNKFNDSLKRGRSPDAIFNTGEIEIPVEVKFSSVSFTKLPSDYRNLIDTPNKWYLFIFGDINHSQNDNFTAWLMRSDELFHQMDLLNKNPQEALFPDYVNPGSIDPKSPTALNDIAVEINKIERYLAQKIIERSVEKMDNASEERGSMSLERRVNGRRVRFDIKFESLLRNVISDILKD